MNVAIVGCGRIGHKRLRALGERHRLVMAVDARPERATALTAERPGAVAEADWHVATARPDVDAVIVSTTNDWLAPITLAAVEADKHVLVEKPAARTSEELEPILAAIRRHRVCVRVGFNHRYHPALQKAREILDSGELGPLMFVRGRYGHGGRLGYEREWRADPRISGGGELLDQGIHLIDLARWFLGDFNEVCGFIHTYFWNAPVEDNAFLMLKTRQEQVAWLHVTTTEWKNIFSFEIYGRNGKLHIEGLGGSYGTERLSYFKRRPEMGPPETLIWEFPGDDSSWRLELEAFAAAVCDGSTSTVPLEDAKAALNIVGTVYRNFQPCLSHAVR